jgi:hypothetical protein
MKPEIKEQWLGALKSGKYSYCNGSLKEVDIDGNVTYCTLGVLCDIYSQTTGTPWDELNGDIRAEKPGRITHLGMLSSLGDEVVEWAGLTDSLVKYKDEEGNAYCLAHLSDDSESYVKPIKAIERYL